MEEAEDSVELLGGNEKCAVCGDAADGHHYGVRSCRGCNAFFRRAITLQMQFTCRRGGKCPVDKNVRCACRSCRLNKCLSVGMDRRAVQPRRQEQGGLPPSFEDIKPEPISSSRSAFTPFAPSTSSFPHDILPSAVPSPPSSSSLITRLSFAFREQQVRRRLMLCQSLEEVLDDDRATLRNPALPEDYVKLFKVQVVLMFEWVESLEEFKMLTNVQDKVHLLRWFCMRYILLDNLFHTIEMGYEDRVVLVNNSYILPGEPPDWRGDDAALSMMYGDGARLAVEELIRPMYNMTMTVGEMMALRLIVFFNPGKSGLTPHAADLIHRASDNTVKELHKYFDEQGLDGVDTRLGNLLLLLPAFSRHTINLFDTVKLIPAFGETHEWDYYMNNLVKF